MVRAVALVCLLGACTPAQAPVARKVGKWTSLGGVTGLVAMAFAAPYVDNDPYVISAFSVLSAIGIAVFAAGDLSRPAPIKEPIEERNHRWAEILTERAGTAAREGNCLRVRRLEIKVRGYDREVHDYTFMRDPAIQKCMAPDNLPDGSQPPDSAPNTPDNASDRSQPTPNPGSGSPTAPPDGSDGSPQPPD